MQLHPESLVLEFILDPSPNLPNFLNPNHVLNTLISPHYGPVPGGREASGVMNGQLVVGSGRLGLVGDVDGVLGGVTRGGGGGDGRDGERDR